MKKGYENFDDIAKDLKILKLRRNISIEELKLIKEQFKDDLTLSNWVQIALKTIGKVGLFRAVKKII